MTDVKKEHERLNQVFDYITGDSKEFNSVEVCDKLIDIKCALNELERLQKFKKTFDEYEISQKQGFISYENWEECENIIKTTIEKIKLRIEGNNRILNTKVNNWLSSQLRVQNTTLELVLMLLGDDEE